MKSKVAAVTIVFASLACSIKAADQSYHVTRTFPIGGTGGWDYISCDAARHLLFVTRSTHVQVVDAETGKTVADIPGQHRNHGVAIAAASGRGFISDSKDACVYIFDLKTYSVLGQVKVDEDADGIQYDPGADKVEVVCGDPGELYAFSPNIDPQHGSAGKPAKLGGSVEYFAFDGHGKAYVNLNEANQVGVVDLNSMEVLAKWAVGSGGKPTGLSIDRENGRLFVGCRDPQRLVILSTKGGKVLGDVPIGAGVDATAFDVGLAFASCRDGSLTVASTDQDGHWMVKQVVATKIGARTLCLDASTHEIYLPTAEFEKGPKPAAKPGSFVILEVKSSGK